MTTQPPDNYIDLTIPETARIIVLSDIHGDHDTFIVNLRDNARVISKSGFNPENGRDQDLDFYYYMVDLTHNKPYDSSLGYKWCGGNTHVVIVGDMIDPYRRMGGFDARSENFYWRQQEVKLLLFINEMNRQAKKEGGRVLKVLGNHDLVNLLANLDPAINFISQHAHPEDLLEDNYCGGFSRINYFKLGNPGGDLILEDRAYVLLKIKNYLFVHGNLPTPFSDKNIGLFSFDDFHNINRLINTGTATVDDLERIVRYPEMNNPLWNRESMPEEIHKRIHTPNDYCERLLDKKKRFCIVNDIAHCDPTIMQVFVGHCIQATPCGQYDNRTYSIIDDSDSIRETLVTHDHSDIYKGRSLPHDPSIRKNKLYGITMECPKKEPHLWNIYHLDVGVGRGQSSMNFFNLVDQGHPACPEDRNQRMEMHLGAVAPHILEISNQGVIKIVRSTINHARIHVPRREYDKRR